MTNLEKRNEMVEAHLYMIDILIRKYLGKGVEYDDLYQVAALALVNAADRYDPSKGYEFKTFATPTILGEIKKYFRDKEWSLRVPRRLKEIAGKVKEAEDAMQLELGRNPNIEELSERTGYTHEEIIQAIEGAKAYGTYSLEAGLDEQDEGASLEKFLGFEETGYERIEIMEIISAVLDKMSDTNRFIFRRRFIENRSQAEIAKELGVSQMTVSRNEKAIINKFREEVQH